jgi:hypothetical protein
MGLTTNLVELTKLGCRRGVDSEATATEVQETVPGVMVGLEEEREGVEDTASSSGSSWNDAATGDCEELGKSGSRDGLGDCLGKYGGEELDWWAMGV